MEHIKEVEQNDIEILEEVVDMLEALKDELKDDKEVEHKVHVMDTVTNQMTVKRISRNDHMYMVLLNIVGQLYQHSYFMKKRGINPEEEIELGNLMDMVPEDVPDEQIDFYNSLKYGEEQAKAFKPKIKPNEVLDEDMEKELFLLASIALAAGSTSLFEKVNMEYQAFQEEKKKKE